MFLEVLRPLREEEERLGFPPFIIRLPVTDEEQAIRMAREAVKHLIRAAKIPPDEITVRLHYCYHDETPRRPCEIRDVTEEILR